MDDLDEFEEDPALEGLTTEEALSMGILHMDDLVPSLENLTLYVEPIELPDSYPWVEF